MKTWMLYLMLMISAGAVVAQSGFQKKAIQILPNSQLTISGDTNINEFECQFNTEHLKEHKNLKYSVHNNSISFQNAVLVLNNEDFDCGNKGINRDFKDLIQADEYPEITLELNKIELEGKNKARADVTISIAGLENQYNIPVEIIDNPVPHFRGTLKINIKDFELHAPKKVFGLIVVKEDVDVNFNLSVQK
ncbi:MAG: YceI family protein [Salegentibacter sp.]